MVTMKKGTRVKRVSPDEVAAYKELGWIEVSRSVDNLKLKRGKPDEVKDVN